MKLRTIVLIVAGAGIPLALIAMLLPITWGYGGFNWNFQASGPPKVTFVDPAGPAARAGMHRGDIVEPLRGYHEILEVSGPTGTRIVEHLIRDGKPVTAVITFTPFSGALAAQEVLNKFLFGFTALIAFAMAMLVTLRARDPNVGLRAALILIAAGAVGFTQEVALVCANAWAALIFARALQPVLSGAACWAALALLAIYPPQRNALRQKLVYAGWAAVAWGCISAAAVTWSYYNGSTVVLDLPAVSIPIGLCFDAVLCLAIVDAMGKAATSYAVPVRWLGVGLLAGVVMDAIPQIALIGDLGWGIHSGDILRAVSSFCVVFGVAYPVLRHRLVDLNILVSRATVFASVSAIIVGVFIAAEWAIGKVFETSLGLADEKRGLAAQIASLVVVLVLGISARSIHRFAEERLTKTFFRKRIAGLEEIERVAHEADASTDADAVIDLATHTIQRALEPLGTAFFLRRGDAYERAAATGALPFPAKYEFNDAAPLRLRRWQQPFEADNYSAAGGHMLFIPMTLRGDVLGFLCCGPKPDHTPYLPDEISALSLLAHHVGIACAWLGGSRGVNARSAQIGSLASDALVLE